jgi:hypothetical protein
MVAMQDHLYDAFVINTPEALFSTYALGMKDYVQTIFYTHNENLVFKNNNFKGYSSRIMIRSSTHLCDCLG